MNTGTPQYINYIMNLSQRSDVSGLESHKVAELKNLYLLVSNQAFGGQRILELLQCLQDIR